MGLDVGTVRFDYSNQPKGISLEFVKFLADNSYEADWELGGYHNVIVEYERENLVGQVDAFVKEKTLSPNGKAEVLDWVDNLPWKESVITLHLNF